MLIKWKNTISNEIPKNNERFIDAKLNEIKSSTQKQQKIIVKESWNKFLELFGKINAKINDETCLYRLAKFTLIKVEIVKV